MKKFFSTVSLQQPRSGNLSTLAYQAVGNTRLQMDTETSFPILTAVNGYVEPGESFRFIAVVPPASRHNLPELETQLKELCKTKGLIAPQVEIVEVPGDDKVSTHTATFQKLLDYVDDDDELFCCMTFGTKPLSQAILLAVQYAYRVKRNASISCIVYGAVDRSCGEKGFVYDMTALTQLDEVVHLLAQRGVSDPKAALDSLLSL